MDSTACRQICEQFSESTAHSPRPERVQWVVSSQRTLPVCSFDSCSGTECHPKALGHPCRLFAKPVQVIIQYDCLRIRVDRDIHSTSPHTSHILCVLDADSNRGAYDLCGSGQVFNAVQREEHSQQRECWGAIVLHKAREVRKAEVKHKTPGLLVRPRVDDDRLVDSTDCATLIQAALRECAVPTVELAVAQAVRTSKFVELICSFAQQSPCTRSRQSTARPQGGKAAVQSVFRPASAAHHQSVSRS